MLTYNNRTQGVANREGRQGLLRGPQAVVQHGPLRRHLHDRRHHHPLGRKLIPPSGAGRGATRTYARPIHRHCVNLGFDFQSRSLVDAIV
jgi:hypothetical protein